VCVAEQASKLIYKSGGNVFEDAARGVRVEAVQNLEISAFRPEALTEFDWARVVRNLTTNATQPAGGRRPDLIVSKWSRQRDATMCCRCSRRWSSHAVGSGAWDLVGEAPIPKVVSDLAACHAKLLRLGVPVIWLSNAAYPGWQWLLPCMLSMCMVADVLRVLSADEDNSFFGGWRTQDRTALTVAAERLLTRSAGIPLLDNYARWQPRNNEICDKNHYQCPIGKNSMQGQLGLSSTLTLVAMIRRMREVGRLPALPDGAESAV
jgi:hypothetical protein